MICSDFKIDIFDMIDMVKGQKGHIKVILDFDYWCGRLIKLFNMN